LGAALRDRSIDSADQLKTAKHDYYTWDEYNAALLERLFTDDRAKKQYTSWGAMAIYERAFHVEVQEFREDVDDKCRRLQSVIDRLELADEPITSAAPAQIVGFPMPLPADANSKVFLVHGHDQALKESVARFLERLDLVPVILHEQPNRGKTIIEKFEAHGGGVAFAVVLLTPDDLGGPATGGRTNPRPRQNVVFELGYFFGRLGRDRVAAILPATVEKPTDIDGLVYIDGSVDWKLPLARELKAAGFDVDMNKAV
jgi:predicted nucleotide-binding protein